MKITRLYTGTDNQSHFEAVDIPLQTAEHGVLSSKLPVDGVYIGEIEDLTEVDWHNPPCRQFIIMLQGAMAIEITDGSKKVFREGDILLAEDLTGRGHKTYAASQGVRRYMAIPLKSGLEF